MSLLAKKKQLSGSARRKIARARLMAQNGGVLPRSTFIPGRPTRIIVGPLDAVSDWKREIGRLFREARAGTLPSDEAARLSYIAQLGVRVAQIEEELSHARAIGEALERANSVTPALEYRPAIPEAGGVAVTPDEPAHVNSNGAVPTDIEAQP